jgi:Fic family protein
VARQSEDALSSAERINQHLDQWRASVGCASVALRLIDLLAANPFITVRKAEAQLNVAYNTAASALRGLARLGIVKQVGEARRDRVFCANALLDILDEPARLRSE